MCYILDSIASVSEVRKPTEHRIYFKLKDLAIEAMLNSFCYSASHNRFTNAEKEFFIPNTYEALSKLYNLTKDLTVYDYMKEAWENKIKMEALKDPLNITALSTGHEKLRPYQKQDVNFIKHLDIAMIFNEMRTGKSITSLMALKERGIDKIFIVAPKITLGAWKAEIEKEMWGLGYKVFMANKAPAKRAEASKAWLECKEPAILIGTTTSMASDALDHKIIKAHVKLENSALVIDEAHFLAYSGTKQTRGMRVLRKHFEVMHLLTGTPGMRDTSNVTSYWGFLTSQAPSLLLATFFNLKAGFMGGHEVIGPKEQSQDVWLEFLNLHSVQRKQREVYAQFSEPVRKQVLVELNAGQYKELSCLEHGYTCNGAIECEIPIVAYMRMRQIALAPHVLLHNNNYGAKTQWLIDYNKDIQTSGSSKPMIIWSMHTKYLELLKQQLKNEGFESAIITGKVSETGRAEAMHKFQKGEVDIILVNIKAGGVGITLDRANVSIFTDRDFLPSSNAQAEARMARTAANSDSTDFEIKEIIDLVGDNSIEVKIHELIEKRVAAVAILNLFTKHLKTK